MTGIEPAHSAWEAISTPERGRENGLVDAPPSKPKNHANQRIRWGWHTVEVRRRCEWTFFDTVYRCYQNFHAGFVENSEGLDAADVDLQLVRIYAMREFL
jgi:hypothetical protein